MTNVPGCVICSYSPAPITVALVGWFFYLCAAGFVLLIGSAVTAGLWNAFVARIFRQPDLNIWVIMASMCPLIVWLMFFARAR